MDFVRLLLLAGSFGVLVCAHVALLAGLWRRPPRRRVLAALVVAPLAPSAASGCVLAEPAIGGEGVEADAVPVALRLRA